MDLLLDNPLWSFAGGVLLGLACLAAAWILGKPCGRRT
jgi:F0F1-type ATP synthase membrane subunit c/vacuolar-type H+-ATPase subunit K